MESCQNGKAVTSFKFSREQTEHKPRRILELSCDQPPLAYDQSLRPLVAHPSELKVLVKDEHICDFSLDAMLRST